MAITINVNLDEILQALKDDLDFTGNADKYIKVNATADGFEFAAVSVGSTWGSITGTLSDQTDLQSALDAKAALAGAAFTGDVSVTTSGSGDTLQLTNSGSGTTLNITNSGSGDFLVIDTDKLVVSNNGNLAVDTDTLFVDSVNDRVGINTSTLTSIFESNQSVSNINDTQHGIAVTTDAYNGTGRHIYLQNKAGNYWASLGGLNGAFFAINTNLTTSYQRSGITVAQFGSFYDGSNFGSSGFLSRIASEIPLTILGKSGQTGDLFRVRVQSGGSTAFNIKADTTAGFGTLSPSAQLHVVPSSTSTVGQIIQAAAGQTANLLEVNSSSGSGGDLLNVNSTGGVTLNATTSSNTRHLRIRQYNNGVQSAVLTFSKARGSLSSPADVSALDVVAGLTFSARVGGTFTQDRSLFGASMATSTGIGIFFIAGSTNNNYVPNMYIHPSGEVTIGQGGSIVSGGVPVNGSAKLQVDSTTQGFLPPRMTGAQVEAIATPAEGLIAYATSAGTGDVTAAGWWGYNGTNWVSL